MKSKRAGDKDDVNIYSNGNITQERYHMIEDFFA